MRRSAEYSLKIICSTPSEKAAVARPRYNPRRPSAGMAMTAPTSAVAAIAPAKLSGRLPRGANMAAAFQGGPLSSTLLPLLVITAFAAAMFGRLQVTQAPEHGGRERVDHEQGEQCRAEGSALERRDENA